MPTTLAFWSSFETGDPLPSGLGAADESVGVDGARCVVDRGPDSSPTAKPYVGFTGLRALRYECRHGEDGPGSFRVRLFEVDLEVEADTELSYVLFPRFTPDLRYPATYAAVDLEFADGTSLADLVPCDQYGNVLTAGGQGSSRSLSADQWNLRRSRIGDVAAGRRVAAIVFAYDCPEGPADVTGWVDDIRIGPAAQETRTGRPSEYVLTTRGTHSSGSFSRGNTIPATAVPNGFNFWTPVTDAGSLTWLYEYHRHNNADNRPELQAFALSHQTSPWMGDRQTFQVMPSNRPGYPDGDRHRRALAFGHEHEVARPHHYAVTFDNGIAAEIAPTDHAAMFRFTFTGDTSTLIFDNVDARAGLTVHEHSGELTAYTDVRSRLSNGATRMFVYATFDRAVVESGRPTGVDDRSPAAGYVRFATPPGQRIVTMRIAASLISLDQAMANLDLEVPSTVTFDDVVAGAQRQWDDLLGVVEVEGATEDQLVTLYSNLYRLFLYPNSGHENTGTLAAPVYTHAVQSSVGTPPSSPTRTGAAVVPGKVYVNNGFWDTYRTTWPAYALLAPRLAGELVDGFLQQYRDGGWVSRWSSPGYANLMVGTSSDVAFADAFRKNVTGFDPVEAYDAAVRNATVRPPDDHVGRKGLETSIFLGYTSEESTSEALSWALDGYINDFGIATMAKELAGHAGTSDALRRRYETEHRYFRNRALGYVHLFDRSVGFFQGRRADGSWRLSPDAFDPRVWGFDYTETNAWNMAFHAPQDGRGLANLYGGPARLAAKLDEFFAIPETGEDRFRGSYGTVIHEMTEARDVRMGMYGHSNQPAHHIAAMYLHAGQPAKMQEKVREVLARLYLGSEIGQGYPGDEDNGEMSAWWVFHALGLYPLRMGSPGYVVGSPLFRRATIHLDGHLDGHGGSGRDLVITTSASGPDDVYVQSLTVNGTAYEQTSLPHDLLAAGGLLEFEMGPRPSDWGTSTCSAPPSLTTDDNRPCPLVDLTSPNLRRGTGAATASTGVSADDLFDDTSATSVTFDSWPAWVAYRLDEPRQVQLYTLTSGPGPADPVGWSLRGSHDGEHWDVLDERSGETFRWRSQTRPFAVDRPGAYAWYRIDLEPGARRVTLAQIELLG
jgi:predicted alpha-1,2-mannosidase